MDTPSDHTGPLGDMFDGFEINPSETAWQGVEERLKAAPLASVFGGFSVEPGTYVWRGIESVLQPGRRRRIAAWWWSAAAIAIVLASGLLWIPRDQPALAFRHSIGPETDRMLALANAHSVIVGRDDDGNDNSEEATPSTGDPKNVIAQPTSPLAENNHTSRKETSPEPWFHSESNARRMATMSLLNLRMAGSLANVLPERHLERPHVIPFIDPPVLEDNSNEFALLAGLSPGLATSASATADNGIDQSNFETTTPTGLLALDSKIDEADYYDYRPPLTIGALAKYPLSKRWSLLSGVQYTLVSGKREETLGIYLNRQSTRQNYLALPLMVSFKLTNWDRGEMNLSTGPVYSFGLREVVTVKSYENAELLNDYSYTNSLSGLGGWRMSAGGAVQLSERFAIYAQAEFSSYLLQRTGSYWSSRSIWPGLNAGIRVGL